MTTAARATTGSVLARYVAYFVRSLSSGVRRATSQSVIHESNEPTPWSTSTLVRMRPTAQHGRRHDDVAGDQHAAARDERMAVAGPFGHVLGETIGAGIEGS